ncbi:MAG TPA: DUF559 domain-containing protein [Polyangiales bacterium]|nr:DUF559 domain-containing protein [Polyangiales bacterium]
MAREALAVDAAVRQDAAFARTAPGRVVCLFSTDRAATHERVEGWAAASHPPSTLVTLEWERAPRLADELDDTVVALARAVQTLFPALYVTAAARVADASWREKKLEVAARRVRGVTPVAARSILQACAAQQLPLLSELPSAVRVSQLALALDPEQLVIELLVHSAEQDSGSLLAFGKGAEWLARNSGARVLAVLPKAFDGSKELDAVSYGAGRPSSKPPPKAARRKRPAANDVAPAHEPPVVSVAAVIGRPHPGSAAECLLHERLSADRELGRLFRYNQLVATRHGTTPRVDIVWPEGRLAIEIDGYADHGRHAKFCQDRERDYFLMASGYRVLRVVDALVLIDPGLVLERIRTVVHYLQRGEP